MLANRPIVYRSQGEIFDDGSSGLDVIRFASLFSTSELTWDRINGTDDLRITHSDGGSGTVEIIVLGHFAGYAIERLAVGDGSTYVDLI